ncbi:SEC10/PgrA surface exclusion domain-containing protein [Streptococcus ruminantium]|uniref:SEC10/PgrA surface exclusion domain-containing protein n=1 Tax=Streptococcus ruminantium TaxID=1917441 RepID=UPI0012DFA225|nr:SEC10/PgrA surface exclusion domain-containing protein [Streptococcus ruminantium]
MKQLTVLSALATAVLSTSHQTIHAEEVPQATEPKPVAETSATQQVTVTEVTAAQSDLDKASQAASNQEEVVNQAQKEVESAQKETNQAQTELVEAAELAEQATPENISKAKEAISKAEEKVTSSTQSLQDKNQEEVSAKEAVKAQEAVVSTAQEAVNKQTQAVTEAQSDVNTAQAILDGTGQAEVIAKAEETAQKLAEDKQTLATAQADLATAKQADTKRATAIEAAERTLSQANQNLEAKTATATQATIRADEAAKQLSSAQEAFKIAENDVKGINTITLSPEYIAALRDYALNYTEKGEAARATLKTLSSILKASNQYKENANDSQTVYEVNNLPEEFRKELSWFGSDLINQIRKAFGTPKTTVTTSSLEFASKVADGYVEDNWSRDDILTTGHDAKAINRAANQFGLVKTDSDEEAQGLQYYENLKVNFYGLKTVSVAEAKHRVYDSILEFMFNEYEWLHAQSIAGLKNEDGEYLGVDFSSSSGISGIHFLTVSPSKLTPSSKFNRTELVNPKTTADIKSRYEVAKNALNQAMVLNNQAQAVKTKTVQDQEAAQNQVTIAQSTLESAQAVPVLTPQAENKLLNAQEVVKKAEKANVEAQTNLANLKADVKVKQANLERAKQTLVQKQAILEQVKQVLTKERDKLVQLRADLQQAQLNVKNAQEQVSTAQSNLKKAQNYLASLKEAPARLEAAKAHLLQVSTVLKAKKEVLKEALDKLAELKQVEVKATHHYQTVLTAYQNHLEAKRQEELAKQYETLVRMGKQPVPVVDGSGRVTGYVADMPKAKLPKTGSQSSSLAMLGLLLAGFTFVHKKRKE